MIAPSLAHATSSVQTMRSLSAYRWLARDAFDAGRIMDVA